MSINELEGRELDAGVATEVMGWIWITSELNEEQKILVPTDESISIPDSSWWWGRDVKALVPHYSRDIAAAMLVAKKLSEKYGVEIYLFTDGTAQVRLDIMDDQHGLVTIVTEVANTLELLPEAICKAARMAAEAE